LATEQAAFQREKMELEAIKELTTRQLPVDFADLLVGDTAEKTMENLDKFQKVFNAAVEVTVQSRLKGSPPQASNGTEQVSTQDQWNQAFK
ncbi:MAG: DUF4355 domain-containing protein, partial [Sporomusa sp.]